MTGYFLQQVGNIEFSCSRDLLFPLTFNLSHAVSYLCFLAQTVIRKSEPVSHRQHYILCCSGLFLPSRCINSTAAVMGCHRHALKKWSWVNPNNTSYHQLIPITIYYYVSLHLIIPYRMVSSRLVHHVMPT